LGFPKYVQSKSERKKERNRRGREEWAYPHRVLRNKTKRNGVKRWVRQKEKEIGIVYMGSEDPPRGDLGIL